MLSDRRIASPGRHLWALDCDDLAGKVNPPFTRPSPHRHDPLLDSRPRRATENGHARDRTHSMEEYRMRTTLRRGAPLVATALLALVGVDHAQAQVAYTANTVTSVYYREFLKDGRYFVFNNAAAGRRLREVRRDGRRHHADRHRARTASPSSPTTRRRSSCSCSSTTSPRRCERPKPPTLNIVWRDGKTRMTIGSNFYLEMSNRVQVRYTHEFPDDTDQARRHRERGRQQGQLPHPPRQAEVRGLVLQALAASTRSRRTGRASRARTSPATSRTRTSTGT